MSRRQNIEHKEDGIKLSLSGLSVCKIADILKIKKSTVHDIVNLLRHRMEERKCLY